MGQFEVHACTDVTGFGLLGHLKSMAAASKVDVELAWEDLPLLPGVLRLRGRGNRPRRRGTKPGVVGRCAGGDRRRRSGAGSTSSSTPQTSGGLLISLPGGAAEALVARLRAEGMEEAAVVGRVVAEGTGRIFVRGRGGRAA